VFFIERFPLGEERIAALVGVAVGFFVFYILCVTGAVVVKLRFPENVLYSSGI